MASCNASHSSFNQPLPWIGLFTAIASLLLAITMLSDAFVNLRHRTYWFPCKFFSLNFVSLTLLSAAVILLGDLNTYMPRVQDQQVKLSSSVLTCVAMANFMPSLGTLEDSQAGLNALGTIVITVLLSVSIQMNTGLIHAFHFEHVAMVILVSLVFLIMCSSALYLPTTKRLLEQKYDLKIQRDAVDMFSVEKLKIFVKARWTTAVSCNPQYSVARSATCSASGVLCVLSSLVFMLALLRSRLTKSLSLCEGVSDYKWSTNFVLISHTVVIVVGNIAPAFRFLHAISLMSRPSSLGDELDVEKFGVQRLEELRDRPLHFPIRSRPARKLAVGLKIAVLRFCLIMQTALILSSKFFCRASVLIANRLKCPSCFGGHRSHHAPTASASNSDIENAISQLEGDSSATHSVLKCRCMDAEQWIRRGFGKKPANMISLLTKSTISQGFKGLVKFDCGNVPSLVGVEPPNCWALPLVTLTSIAMAIAHSCSHHNSLSINPLILGVDEGLKFVRLIEKNLNATGSTTTNRAHAADIVWLQVELYQRWFDVNLLQFPLEENNPRKILEELARVAKGHVEQNMAILKKVQDLPAKVLAANSMYRTCLTILQLDDSGDGIANACENMFEKLQITIADILAACLTKLPRLISMQCSRVAIESREERIREAAYLLGEAEEALGYLGQLQSVADLDIESMAPINNWRWNKVRKTIPVSLRRCYSDSCLC